MGKVPYMEKVWVFSWDYNVKYLKYIHSDAVNMQVICLSINNVSEYHLSAMTNISIISYYEDLCE